MLACSLHRLRKLIPSTNFRSFRRNLHQFQYPNSKSDLILTELESKSLVRLSGPDTLSFLQGLITNDTRRLDSHKCIYAFFLNQQGRILFDALLYTSSNGSILVECDASIKQPLIRNLQLYRVKRDVTIEDEGTLKPWVVWNPWHPQIDSDVREHILPDFTCERVTQRRNDSDPSSPLRLTQDITAIPDPRLGVLGWRLILPIEQRDIVKPYDVNLFKFPEITYRTFLYSLGIGEGVVDLPIGNCFPLESNGDILRGINFHKGCYIGQELTARTHYTGVVRKRLMPFWVQSEVTLPSEVDKSTLRLVGSDGRQIARVRNIINSCGLALARVTEALASTEVKLGDHLVQIRKPKWWPYDFSREHMND